MKTITSEWITKAEADFATAKRELAATEQPNHDAVCFHAGIPESQLIRAKPKKRFKSARMFGEHFARLFNFR